MPPKGNKTGHRCRKGSPGLPVTSGTSKRDRDAGRTAQITPNTNRTRARCCSCCRSPQEDADQREDTQNRTGSEKLSHEITGDSLSSVKDGESFNENTGGYEMGSKVDVVGFCWSAYFHFYSRCGLKSCTHQTF